MKKFGGAPKCRVCQKSVYAAEKAPAGDFHKACCVCSTCKKSVDSTTMCENNDKLFCKACYNKQFGPKIFGYGGGGAIAHTGGDSVNTNEN